MKVWLFRLLRVLGTVTALWLVLLLLPRWLPEDPARIAAGEGAPEVEVEALRHRLHLDGPWHRALATSASEWVRGDLGESLRHRRPVTRILMEGFPVSLRLALLGIAASALLAWVLAHLKGPLGRWLPALAVASPVYVLGPLLLWAVAQHLPGLPVSGTDSWRSWILPTLALAVPLAGHQARLLQVELEAHHRAPGPRLWEGQGIPSRWRTLRWTLPAVAGPWLSMLGLQLGGLLGGAVLVESLFSLPGLGQTMVGALSTRDLPLMQGAALFGALLYGLTQAGVEGLQAALDPRLR